MTTTLIETIARALYRMNGHPRGDTAFESEPMWQRYIARAHEVMDCVRESVPEDADPMLWPLMIDCVIATTVESGEA